MEYQDFEKMVKAVKERIDFDPEIGVVLGSGFSVVLKDVDIIGRIPFSQIPGMPLATNKNHSGELVFASVNGKKVIFLNGRIHLYEGYSPSVTVTPQRLLGLLGCKTVILTNAAGGVNRNFKVGDLMVIQDHIVQFVPSPLIGKNIDELGPRFPDMSDVYNRELSDKIYEEGLKAGLPVQKGVYIQFTGPQYETRSEIKMASMLGADAVGMSTAIEAMALNHMGVKVVGISLVTNMACGITDNKLDDDEVIVAANRAEKDCASLLFKAIDIIHGHE